MTTESKSPLTRNEAIMLILETHVNLNHLNTVTVSPLIYDLLLNGTVCTMTGSPITTKDRQKRWRPLGLPLGIWVTILFGYRYPYEIRFTTMQGESLNMNLEDYHE